MSQKRFVVFHRKKERFIRLFDDRYIQYLCDLSLGTIERPHFTELIVKTINLAPVPLFNRDRFD